MTRLIGRQLVCRRIRLCIAVLVAEQVQPHQITKFIIINPRLIKKLRELRKQYPEQFILEHREHGSVTYTIPKRCVGIRPPYSEKRREQQRQKAKENGLPFMEKGEMNDGKN